MAQTPTKNRATTECTKCDGKGKTKDGSPCPTCKGACYVLVGAKIGYQTK